MRAEDASGGTRPEASERDGSAGVAPGRATRNVLIHTVRNDFHATVVAHALGLRGHRVIRWIGQDYPERITGSVSFMDDQVGIRFSVDEAAFTPSQVDVVWFRRHATPVAPSFIDRRDVDFVTDELQIADTAHARLFDHAFWINSTRASAACDVKTTQLMVAKAVGMTLPRTLVSNDPKDIRAFLSRGEACIYKPLSGHIWTEEGRTRKTYTAEVTLEHLPADPILQATPGIFQQKVRKSYEVRVQFFGAFYAGVKIESSSLRAGDLDWRIDQDTIASCQPVVLPTHVYAGCRDMMRRLGIVSGGFDFIVDDCDQWIFMEVNEAGQFLFIESWCEQLPLLDAFCQFIESADADFEYEPPPAPLSLKGVCAMAEQAGVLSRHK